METWDLKSLDVQPHHPQVLRSDGEARLVAINLPAGEELQDHQVHERAYLVVADGEVEVVKGDESVSAGAGTVTHFDPNERHEVRATSDARLLLLLAPWPAADHGHVRDDQAAESRQLG